VGENTNKGGMGGDFPPSSLSDFLTFAAFLTFLTFLTFPLTLNPKSNIRNPKSLPTFTAKA
uniref:hypothetical protein n=1 Tax=uncultured Mucilaginibacter sp. TaxID=797541 RepID=UPI0025CBA67D